MNGSSHDREIGVAELVELIDETRLLFNTLSAVAEELHAADDLSTPDRAVLDYLERHGPETVPGIARARRVTRQSIQVRVNTLTERGWVALEDNPAHRRSPLVTLTPEGAAIIGAARAREHQLLAAIELSVPVASVVAAAEALRAVRSAIDETAVATSDTPPTEPDSAVPSDDTRSPS